MPTNIVLLGSRITVTVDQQASAIAGMSGIAQLTQKEQPLFVNLANVLYMQPAAEPFAGAM